MAFNFSSVGETIKSIFQVNREKIRLKNILLYVSIITIFLIALFIRLTPAAYEAILKGFDPYFQYRQTQYIVEHGFSAWFNWDDPLSWYPWGREVSANSYPGLPFAAAAVYLFLSGIGLQIDLLQMCWAWPAVMGALTSVAAYFLGKEVGSKKIGLLAALFLALMPAYFQRTIAGFFDNETIGILLMVLTTYFYIRSIKRESIISGVFAGAALAYLSITWGANIYFFYLIPLFNLVLLVTKKYRSFNLIPYSLTVGIPLLIGTHIPMFGGVNILMESQALIAIGVLGILALYEVLNRFRKTPLYDRIKFYRLPITGGILCTLAASLLVLTLTGQISVIASLIESGLGLSARFISIINPLSRSDVYLVASVGEHATTAWGIFYYYLYVPIFLFPLGIYFIIKRLEPTDILLLFALITSLYFAASMIRILLVLAPFISLFAAYGLVSLIKPFSSIISKESITVSPRKRRVSKMVTREYAVVAFGLVFILLAANVWHAVDLSKQFAPSDMVGLGVFYDWQQSFEWMRNNLGTGRVILSWWDYGYWITAVANETTLMDNGTFNETQIATLGLALMSGEVEALKIMRQYGVEYVLVHFGYFTAQLSGDEGKWIWMVRIASDNYPEIINESQYYNSTSGKPTSKFFDSLIYKLLFYKEPGSYYFASQVNQYMTQLGYPVYQSYPTSQRWMYIGEDSQYPMFEESYISSNNLVKIYRVDYTILDMSLEILNTSIYTFDDKTSALITIRNNGSVPVTVDTSPSSVRLNGSTVASLNGHVSIAEGAALMYPGGDCTVKIDINVNSTVGASSNIDMKSIEFYGYRQAAASAEIRAAGTLGISVIDATAYSNETIFLDVENTGQEYLTVSNIYVNGSTSGITIQGDLTLSPGQMESYRLTLHRALNPSLNLNVSDTVNINVSSWEGVSDLVSGVSVQLPPNYNFTVSNVNAYSNETILLNINNYGDYSVSISHLLLETGTSQVTIPNSLFTALNGTKTVPAGSTVRYLVSWSPSLIDLNQTDLLNITVYVYEGLDYTADNISVTAPLGYDYTVPYNQSYDNETAYLVLKNNGSYPISIKTIYANTTEVSLITPVNGSLTINPGVSIQYITSWDPFLFNVSSGEVVSLNILTYQDINRTAYSITVASNYSLIIDSVLTQAYTNKTLFITINNTSPGYSISNLTIYVVNQTSGEYQYFSWIGTLNPASSLNHYRVELTDFSTLYSGNELLLSVKSVENASYQTTVTVT